MKKGIFISCLVICALIAITGVSAGDLDAVGADDLRLEEPRPHRIADGSLQIDLGHFFFSLLIFSVFGLYYSLVYSFSVSIVLDGCAYLSFVVEFTELRASLST